MTHAGDDAADEGPPDREASPEATGGIGTSYEHVCIATYLAALLTRSHAPACPGVVTRIALQQKANGRPLDDIVMGWQDDTGRKGTVDLQLKRRLSVSPSDESDFSRIVSDAWATVRLADFTDRRDLAGGLSELVSSANHYACQKLRELAGETDPAGFATAVATQVDGPSRRANAAVQAILTRTLGAAPTQEDTHFFWRNFVIGRLEATANLGIDRLRAIDQLGRIAPQDGANPTQLFAVLEALARQLNVHAADVDRAKVVELLRERFGTTISALPGDLMDALDAGRHGAALELDGFRGHPALLLVIATRAGTASPFSQATTLTIHPFDRDRQLDAAARLLGPAGHDLVVRARAVPALRPLLRTPLFLAAILNQGASGNLPADRETVIAGLVSGAGGTPARREQLRLALDGQQSHCLQAIADQMMNAGTTFIPEAALLPVIGEVVGDLRARHLLVQPVSPQAVLDLLISHHVLVSTGAPSERTVSFQHQLIQEWFASHRVEAIIAKQAHGAIEAALRGLIDAPFWSVTLLFAVDRLSRSGAAKGPLRSLILTTLGIDPFLAAEMFIRAKDSLGGSLDHDIVAFGERWVEEDPQRAKLFMLATGLNQFADRLWSTLEQSGELAFGLHRTDRRFPLTALERDWDRHFPKLGSQTRRVLLTDLVEQGDAASLALSLWAAIKDPSAEVVSGVIDYLDFRDERAALERLLDSLPGSMWSELARGRVPDNLTDRHRATWQRHRRKRLKRAEGLEWINLALDRPLWPARERRHHGLRQPISRRSACDRRRRRDRGHDRAARRSRLRT